MNKKALIEVLKSFGRFMWFGLLALISTFLVNVLADGSLSHIVVTIAGQQLDMTYVVLTGLGLLIKMIDRYVHANKNIELNGIAPTILQK